MFAGYKQNKVEQLKPNLEKLLTWQKKMIGDEQNNGELKHDNTIAAKVNRIKPKYS